MNLLKYCADLPEISLIPGDYLITEGKKSGRFFILIEGSFEIIKQNMQINKVSEPGSVFGEISVLLNIPHLASVVALEKSRLYVVGNPKKFLASNNEISYFIAIILAQRLNTVTSTLIDIRHKLTNSQLLELGYDFNVLVDEVLENLTE